MPTARTLVYCALLFLSGMVLGPIPQAHAQTFTVNVIDADADDVNAGDGFCDSDGTTVGNQCTLRAAISEANARAGPDTIALPAGTITLTLEGAYEDENATGDLDITDSLIIDGAPLGASGVPRTIIQSGVPSTSAHDRVFQIHGEAATVVFNGLTIQSGKAPDATSVGGGGSGGGISNGSTLTLNDCIVIGNEAGDGAFGAGFAGRGGDGGGIYNWGTLTLNRSTVLANSAGDGAYSTGAVAGGGGGCGGGIASAHGTLTVNDSALTLNAAGEGGGSDGSRGGAGGHGGGICLTGASVLAVSNSTLANNNAGKGGKGGGAALDGLDGDGGGVYYNGTATLRGSTVSRNTARMGGGLYAAGVTSCELTLENSTVSGNGADGSGGGIKSSGVLRLHHSTVASNEAGRAADQPYSGGGLYVTGTAYLMSTIVGDNEAFGSRPDWNCSSGATIVSQGYNLLEDTTGCTFAPTTGDATGSDPNLGALGDNGGPTRTHPLQAGSQAIDRIPDGTNGCQAGVSLDQRGYARAGGPGQGGAACDTGAYEYDSGPAVMFSASTYEVGEDSGSAQIQVNLAGTSENTITVDYATEDDTAIAGEDYAATTGTLTFEPGDTSQTFIVPILDDGEDEGAETLHLSLSNPDHAGLGEPAEATLTIRDLEDAPKVQFSSRHFTVFESAGTATIAVTLSAASNRLVEVDFETSDGTARAGRDYTAVAGSLAFYPADRLKAFTVAIQDDDRQEGHETINLALSDPTNARLGSRDTATLTVLDDETPVPLFLPLVIKGS